MIHNVDVNVIFTKLFIKKILVLKSQNFIKICCYTAFEIDLKGNKYMSTLYLHIGTPKTGTTSLQRFFIKNRSALRNKGCKFPVFKYDTGVHISHNGRFLSPATKDKKFVQNCFENIYQLAEKYPKIILTEELLWNTVGNNKKFWEELNKNLSDHSITLKVIVYLRRQDEYIISLWGQKIKGRKSKKITFDKFLKNRNEKKHLDYYEYLCNIASVIGKKNVIVRPYEFCQFQGGSNNIFSDFLQAIGIECDESFKFPERLFNESLKGNVLETKRFLNMIPEFNVKADEFRSYFWEIQQEMKNEGKLKNCSTFLNNEREKFMSEHKISNSLTAREFLNRQDGMLFLEPLPQNDAKEKFYTVDEIKIVLDKLILKLKKDMFAPIPPDNFQMIYDKALDIAKNEYSKQNKNIFFRFFHRKNR